MPKRKHYQIENNEEELKFAKICSQNEQHEFQKKRIKTSKSDTKTITIKKAKAKAKKAREAKRIQRIDESTEIREERIE